MRIIPFFLIFIVFSFLLFPNPNTPVAVKGVIDLSNWDFSKNGAIKLDGEYEFYFEKFYIHDDFIKQTVTDKRYINVLDNWNSYKINNKVIGPEGYGTYRLLIKIKPTKENMGISIPEIATSNIVWINGMLISSAGKPEKIVQQTKNEYYPKLGFFKVNEDEIELIIHIASNNHRSGGVMYKIEFGTAKQIYENKEKRIAFEMILLGSILIIGIYHLGIFSLRRKEYSALYFGLLCLMISARIPFTGEYFYHAFFPFIQWEYDRKTEYITYFLSLPLFIYFVNSILVIKIPKIIVISISVLAILESFAVLIVNVKLASNITIPFHLVTIVSYFIFIYYLILSIRKGSKEAIITFCGFMVLLITVINDILYSLSIIQTGNFIGLGIFIFIFFQSFMLSLKFSHSFIISERLLKENNKINEKLRELNESLEKKVAERTSEINNTIELLKIAQENQIIYEKTSYISNITKKIAHEINSPMAAVVTGIEFTKESIKQIKDSKLQAEFYEDFEHIEKAILKARTITSKLLEFSSNEDINRKNHEVSFLVEETLAVLGKSLEEFSVKNKFNFKAKKVLWVKTVDFIQLLSNIILEVTKLIEKNNLQKRITISGYDKTNNIVVEVYNELTVSEKSIDSKTSEYKLEIAENTSAYIKIALQIVEKIGGEIILEEKEKSLKFKMVFPIF